MSDQECMRSIEATRFTPELWAAVRAAAERRGMLVEDWVAEVLRTAAHAALTGKEPPPARPVSMMVRFDRRLIELGENLKSGFFITLGLASHDTSFLFVVGNSDFASLVV